VKKKGRRKGDARRRFSRRRPRLVGHARAAFARCARRGGIASAPIAAVGHVWATGHRAVRNGMAVMFVSVVRVAGENGEG
jgi:hypothetical protein